MVWIVLFLIAKVQQFFRQKIIFLAAKGCKLMR